jgi:hypothetical protein
MTGNVHRIVHISPHFDAFLIKMTQNVHATMHILLHLVIFLLIYFLVEYFMKGV